MINSCPAMVQIFEISKVNHYRRFLAQLGSAIDFGSDKWVFDKRMRSGAECKGAFTLYFTAIPGEHKEMIKYYCITCFINGAAVKSVGLKLFSLSTYCRFLNDCHPESRRFEISHRFAYEYCGWLNRSAYAENTKSTLWYNMDSFCRMMRGWDPGISVNPFSENPYSTNPRHNYKYIHENTIKQLDTAFLTENIMLHVRCAYWIMRLIPSRINEVLGMKVDCLKPYNGHFCLFIPTWKQNGGYFKPELRVIHIQETGIAAELLQLIRRQQDIAESGYRTLEDKQQGYLFTFQKCFQRRNGRIDFCKDFMVATDAHIRSEFTRVCENNNILDEKGSIFHFTPHQLRHNGITDRLAAGFTPEQIRFMTAQHGSAMIHKAYNHLDLLPEVIADKQRYVLGKAAGENPSQILFGGRILNMEEQLEKRLLKNIRAHKILGGICGDITGCKSDMFFCLDCKHFIPDAEQLDYFVSQADSWLLKAKQFSEFQRIKSNAEENARLFKAVAEKIVGLTGGIRNG